MRSPSLRPLTTCAAPADVRQFIPDREYARMREAEDTHWWYRTLRSLVSHELARRIVGGGPPPRVLDAGCGTGGGLGHWTRAVGARCYGIDVSSEALSHTRSRGERLIAQASIHDLPFRDGSVDAVVCLDVLCREGVEEERALAEIRRVLLPGGLLILNAPAFETLRGEHDRAVRTRRRFTRGELDRLLHVNGFLVTRVSYWNALLFPVVWVVRRLRSGRHLDSPSSDIGHVPAVLNAALRVVLTLEQNAFRVVGLPFGTSVLAVARSAERDLTTYRAR